ncbi:MAG: hypothetical protein MUC59_16830, partial [Saprospiraceae bacterium]|nr:hypothetical protein [Saprospiraceae bacterium]
MFFMLLLSLSAKGQQADTAIEGDLLALFDIFSDDEIPEMTITADFDSVKANVKNKLYVYGQIEVEKSKKQSKKLTVRLRPRGKSRRLMCDFPPLKLKFDKDELLANGIQQFNDFKLVTHCIEGDAKSEALIKKEYLVYQLCNKMTPYSFNAKLVRITYKNKGSSFKKMTHLGILIEDAESLANRNNCEVTASKVINLDSMHTNHEKIASMFQYMIGNADWSYMMGRNMELIRTSER